MPKTLSTISATTAGGRNGQGKTSDGRVSIDFAGKDPEKTTPEHLFALGYSACFGSALQAVAGMQKKTLPADFAVTVTVPLIMGDDHGYSIEAHLKVSLPGMDKAEAEKLVETAHQVCPYSKATRNNIPVTLSVA
jgi:osmotically inducible protein OsmC